MPSATTPPHRQPNRTFPDGTIANGDGGPARDAALHNPSGVYVNANGTIFISTPDTNTIRKVGVDGRISTVVSGPDEVFGSGAPPSFAPAMCVDQNNTIYVGSGSRVYRIQPDGTRTPVAGRGRFSLDRGDGGLALQATLATVSCLSFGLDGALYIGDRGDSPRRVRYAGPPAWRDGDRHC